MSVGADIWFKQGEELRPFVTTTEVAPLRRLLPCPPVKSGRKTTTEKRVIESSRVNKRKQSQNSTFLSCMARFSVISWKSSESTVIPGGYFSETEEGDFSHVLYRGVFTITNYLAF